MNSDILSSHGAFDLDHTSAANVSFIAHEAHVYNYMRDWIIALTFFTTLFALSHFMLRVFIRRAEDDIEHVYLPIILCTVSFSISLAAMLLVPITIASNEVILNFPNSYYTQWLHRELIFALWNKIFWGANVALFLVLPFSYFYYEAGGIGRGILAKFNEAVIVLVLVAMIFGGFVYLLHKLVFIGVIENTLDYLPFSYSLISASGALVVLLSTPRGFTTITSHGLRLYLPAATKKILAEKIYALDMEEQVIEAKLKERPTEAEVARLRIRMDHVRTERASLHHTTMHPLVRNSLFVFATILNMSIAGYVMLRVFSHLLRFFINPHGASNLADFLALQDASHRLGSFASILQIAVIIYLMSAAFLGFYNFPRIRVYKPRIGDTSIAKLIINMAFILLISSSFPVVARILEITSFDLLGEYNTTSYLRNSSFFFVYKVLFIMAFTHRYVTFFNQSLTDTGLMPFVKKCIKMVSSQHNSSNSRMDIHLR